MSRSILIFFLAVLFTLAWHDVSHAQPDGGATKQLWIDVNPAYFITPDFKLYGDVGMRREFDDYGWWKLVVRPTFEIHLGSIFYLTTVWVILLLSMKLVQIAGNSDRFRGSNLNGPTGKYR